MAKGGAVRHAGIDGLCDLITSFWISRQLTMAATARVLRMRGVKHPDDLEPLAGDENLSRALNAVFERAAIAGVETESLVTLFRAAKRDALIGSRMHELARTFPQLWVDSLESSPFLSEEYEMPAHVLWWGRIRGMLERWATKPGAELSPSQKVQLENGLRGLGSPDCHLHVWTDHEGQPHIEYWADGAMQRSPVHLIAAG